MQEGAWRMLTWSGQYIKIRNGKFHSGTKNPDAKSLDEIIDIFCRKNKISDIDMVMVERKQFERLLAAHLINYCG